MNEFVHLHCHTEYSILDGVGRIEEMAKKASKNESKALSITDHGSVSGHIPFQIACSKRGIKPIFGCEFYTCENHLKKNSRVKNHLVLLAKNEIGYKNLIKLASIAAVDGFYYKPRIDFKLLEKYHEGLICLSACIGGEIPQKILNKFFGQAFDSAKKFKNLFGKDYYLELQPNRLPEQRIVNAGVVDLAKELDIELVVTNDAHYPNKDDWMAHEIILCIKTHAKMSDKDRFKFDDNTFYLMTEEEILEAFKEHHIIPEEIIKKAIKNTSIIANKCNHTINKKNVVLPMFKLPNEFMEENEYLDFLAHKNFKESYVIKKIEQYSKLNNISFEETKKIYIDRLEMELKTIKDLNFSRYILIVWEIYQFCKKEKIACGPGRGSVSGSLLAYILEVTTVDPIENELYFGRFLTSKRIDYPDIDMDFEDSRRHEVVQHLKDLYGEDKVANISTFGRMKGKSVLKDVARVFSVPYHEVNKITDLIVQNIGTDAFSTIKSAVENIEEMKDFANKYPEVVKHAQKLEGQIRQKGIHAAGIVVSEKPIEDVCPVEKRDDKLITSFDGYAAESIGLLKLDVLGLKTMTIIKDTLENIKKSTGKNIKLNEISLNDKNVFNLFNKGLTAGVFQLETPIMTKLCRKVGVNKFEDIVHINALGRPGTMRSGATEKYIKIKHNKIKSEYIHPAMKPITEETYSIILFQEQVMRVLADIGNFDWKEVDAHRKIISKSKGTVAFEKARKNFIKGVIKNGIDKEVGEKLYNQLTQYSSYSFNKCISGDTIVQRADHNRPTIEYLFKIKTDKEYARRKGKLPLYDSLKRKGYGKILSVYEDGRIRPNKIIDIYKNGEKEVWKLQTENNFVEATLDHRFLISTGWKKLKDICVGDMVATIPIKYQQVTNKEFVGTKMTYDIEMEAPNHNFIANGFVSHNSHSAAYSTISFWCCWLKYYYPNEFFAAALSQTDGKEQEYIKEARKLGVQVFPPDINESGLNFISKDNKIIGSLRGVKGLGNKGIEVITKNRPYKNFQDFIDKMSKGKVNKKSIEALIQIGAFGQKGAKLIYDNYLVGKSIYQKTLFDFGENPNTTITRDWTPSEFEKFQSELYILPPIVHPIEKYANLIGKMEIASDFNLISEIDFNEQKGETIWLRGTITQIRYQNWGDKLAEKPTPDHSMYKYYSQHPWNARHCIFDIEDETNFTLCSVFPDVFEKHEAIINKGVGTPILVKGRIGFNIDRIYIQEIYDLNDIDSGVKSGKLSKTQKCLFENPLREYEHLKHIPICDLEDSGAAIGIFGQPKLHIDKNGKEMAFVSFEDMTGSITIICFASDWVYKKKIMKEGIVAGINLRKMQGDGKTYSANKIVLLDTSKV